MHKLVLISAFLLASVSAYAGDSRNITLAAADETRAVETTAKPQETQARETQVQTSAQQAGTGAATPEASKTQASKSSKKTHARHHEGDESKARRIAAKYGVYW
jgi:hypothetical protein